MFALEVIGNRSEIKSSFTGFKTGRPHDKHSYPHQLSAERASIEAFVNRPPILLADEPTENGPDNIEGIMKILSRINLIGTTVLMATHDKNIVNSMRRRAVELEEGK